MKIAKYISDNLYNDRDGIINNYFIVENDYDFSTNLAEDVTSRNTLLTFFSIGRISYQIFRKSLISNVLPNWNTLSSFEKEDLIYDRIYPSTITQEEILGLVGSIDEWNTIKNTKTEFEYIDEIKDIVDTYFYVDKNEKESTSENVLQTYLQLNVSNIPSGRYKLEYSVIGGNDRNKKQSEFDFYLDGENVATPIIYASESAGTTQSTNIGLLKDLESGSHSLEVKYSAINGSAFIGFASIRLSKEA